jgi:hypothetical protein
MEGVSVDDRGQMLLLSALFASICLMTVAMAMESVDKSAVSHHQGLSREVGDNAIWALDDSLVQTGLREGNGTWEDRDQIVATFKGRVHTVIRGLEKNLLCHGIAFRFAFNDSLARSEISGNDTESLDGVLIKRDGDTARISGCGFDARLSDGRTEYTYSVVKVWL